MKKLFVTIFILIFSLGIICAEEDETSYWYNEVDYEGILTTEYYVKTEAQLANNFKMFVNKSTGLECIPNLQKIKSSMVSCEYLKKNYPHFSKVFFEATTEESINEYNSDGRFLYYYYSDDYDEDDGLITLVKYLNKKAYISFCRFEDKGKKWIYNKEFLDLAEELCSEEEN